MSYSNVKSVVIDIADSWNSYGYFIGIRRLEFYDDSDTLYSITSSDYSAYATSSETSSYSGYPANAFNTSLSKIGTMTGTEWVSEWVVTSQRLICVFNSSKNISKIVSNNGHSNGNETDQGANNVKIYFSTDTITDTTYNASISNGTLVYDGQIAQHIASNVADDQTLTLIESGGSGVIEDTVSDELALTDSVDYDFIEKNRVVEESVSLDESIGVAANWLPTLTESLSMIDSIIVSGYSSITLEESLNLAENISILRRVLQIISDSLGVSDTLTVEHDDIARVLNDGFTIYDNSSFVLVLPISETMVMVDSFGVQRVLSIVDYSNLEESLFAKWDGTKSITDNLTLIDAASVVRFFRDTISESLAIGDSLSSQIYALINEYLDFRDVISKSVQSTRDVNESIQAVDNIVAYWLQSVSDSMAATDTTHIQISLFLSEYANIVESLNAAATSNLAISDSLAAVDSAISRWLFSLTDSVSVTDSARAFQYLSIAEYLNARDNIGSIAKYSIVVLNSINAVDDTIATWFLGLTEECGITEAVNAANAIYEIVNDSVSMTEILSVLGSWNRGLTDSLIASDVSVIISRVLGEIEDSFEIVDTVSLASILSVLLSESLGVADSSSLTKKSYLLASDDLGVSGEVSSNSSYWVTVQEMLSLNITMIVDGEVYECFALNTAKFHPSIYSGFDFNSYCVFRNSAFGANNYGVFELTGETDNGQDIHTGIIFHDTDFGLPSKKKFRKAYLTVEGNTPYLMMESDGFRKSYRIDDKGMVDSSRAVKGKTWTLSVADFENIESMKLIPVILARGN